LKPLVSKISLLALAVVILFLLNVAVGSTPLSPSQLAEGLWGEGDAALILWQFRLPKAVTCVLAGCGLAVSGLLMQTLFRNPLVGPDVLGLSSGAGLTVAVILLAGPAAGAFLGSAWGVATAASLGSALVFLLMLAFARRLSDPVSLLIIGLMTAATASSLVSVLQYMGEADDLQAYVIWTMGTVGATHWGEIAVLTAALGAGLIMAAFQLKAVNALVLGERYAATLGVPVRHTRFWMVAATSVIIGSITSFCGPIAFVGLAVPHLIRLLMPTANHQYLIPAVALGGALLLLACDLICHLPGATQLLPLNAITSLVGAPVVVWMVLRSKVARV
jgi:iron complex transport system permease protein